MEHRYRMSPNQVERALESAYDAAESTDFNHTGFLGVIGSTYENAKKFRKHNQKNTGSHDIDIVALPKDNYNLDGFLTDFNKFWKTYAKQAREKGMYTSTYSDSSHETQANWITSKLKGEEGKIPGHALLFPSKSDIKNQAPEGFYDAVKDNHIPLEGSFKEANNNPTPQRLGEFISEYHGPSGPLITDSFPEEVEWRTLEQIINYTDEHYEEFVDDREQFSEVADVVERAAIEGPGIAQVTPQELHQKATESITSGIESIS